MTTEIPTVSIEGLDRAVLLAALYNAAHPVGMGHLHYDPAPMTPAEARILLDGPSGRYFDYVKGRVMKVDLSHDSLRTDLYDRDNGPGAAEIVAGLRRAEAEETNR